MILAALPILLAGIVAVPTPIAEVDGTQYVVVEADDPQGAVVFLHGWSHGMTAEDILPYTQMTAIVDDIVEAGWTVYAPFLDEDWGTAWESIGDVLDVARADGFSGGARLVAVSAGAVTALNWAWRNPGNVETVHLITPVFDLAAVHASDTPDGWNVPSMTASIDRHVDDVAEFDPARHVDELAQIGYRIGVYAARDDELIDWTALGSWADQIGASVVASAEPGVNGGGHVFATSKPAWAFTSALWFD